MKQIYVNFMAERLACRSWQVENCVTLLEDGDTIPFISRYRKEMTGGLDDAAVAEVKHYLDVFTEMEKRKETVLEAIEAAGKLTPRMRSEIESCTSSTALEDIYLPFRPKRRTRASVAKEKGLEPLADLMWDIRTADPVRSAGNFLTPDVPDAQAALAGARDIIAERLSETAWAREQMRCAYRQRRVVSQVTKAGKTSQDADKYRSYFSFSMPLKSIPSHNLLAILRAGEEGFLSVSIDADPERCCETLYRSFLKGRRLPDPRLSKELKDAFQDSFGRLIDPSITNEIIKEAKAAADIEAIRVFGENLRQLLLSAPVGEKRTMAIDPGFRNGCKIAVLAENGELLHHEIIFPHPPQSDKVRALMRVQQLLEEYGIQAVAVGNGTASRETMEFVRKLSLPDGCKVWSVSEDGASIYSASEAARKEFPNEDVTVRGAVSIGRRLMDPLSELVKIDPKNLGVGQYQHDVDQKLLKEKLDNTVEFCVNAVGVNLNTASAYLLAYVSGIGPALAENIIAYRTANGAFRSRADLKKVPRLGDKAFEQCAGFLRIKDGTNPLDNSAVHPESYPIVQKMASDLGVGVEQLVGSAELCASIDPSRYVTAQKGLPTITDILKELAKPGLDPRQEAKEFSFAEDIRCLEDLKIGMELPGIVTNITNFGAFVDIGLHENGLLHVSRMGPRGTDPSKVVRLGEHLTLRVESVDSERRRIGLALAGKSR